MDILVGPVLLTTNDNDVSSASITLTLTGVSATASIGSLTFSNVTSTTVAIPSVMATGSVGSLAPSLSTSLTLPGVSSASVIGSLIVSFAADITLTLVGVESTSAVGTLNSTLEPGILLTGVSATGQVGTLIPAFFTTGCMVVVGTPYVYVFVATGGVAPYTWALVDGAFPPGLSLSSDGILSGTPTFFAGVYMFSVRVTDSDTPPTSTILTCSFTGPEPTCTHPLHRIDEYAAQSFSADWALNPDSPFAFSISVTPPVQLQLVPPPATPGTLDLCTVDIGPALDLNPLSPAVLGIPDDLCWGTKWGALAQLLSSDGDARDPSRSQAAQDLYNLCVSLGRTPISTLMVQVDGSEAPVSAIADFDQYNPEWQCTRGRPSQSAMVGANLLVLAGDDINSGTGIPDAAYPITLDLARSFPVPSTATPASSYIQLGPELLSAILDLAQHIASFKMAGPEFLATTELRNNFLRVCGRINSRLKSNAVYNLLLTQPATRQDFKTPITTPREEDKVGSGGGGN